MADWKFYGRKEQLAELERMLDRKRWFFAKVTGRRRIGKTTLIQRAMQEIHSKQPVFYLSNGMVFGNQAFTFQPNTFMQGNPNGTPTEMVGAGSDSSTRSWHITVARSPSASIFRI